MNRDINSIVMTPEIVDGAIEVAIPDILLQRDGFLLAYLCSTSENDGVTKYCVRITVNKRAKPEFYDYDEHTTSAFQIAVNKIQVMLDNGELENVVKYQNNREIVANDISTQGLTVVGTNSNDEDIKMAKVHPDVGLVIMDEASDSLLAITPKADGDVHRGIFYGDNYPSNSGQDPVYWGLMPELDENNNPKWKMHTRVDSATPDIIDNGYIATEDYVDGKSGTKQDVSELTTSDTTTYTVADLEDNQTYKLTGAITSLTITASSQTANGGESNIYLTTGESITFSYSTAFNVIGSDELSASTSYVISVANNVMVIGEIGGNE